MEKLEYVIVVRSNTRINLDAFAAGISAVLGHAPVGVEVDTLETRMRITLDEGKTH